MKKIWIACLFFAFAPNIKAQNIFCNELLQAVLMGATITVKSTAWP
jgi:hypothetical protein